MSCLIRFIQEQQYNLSPELQKLVDIYIMVVVCGVVEWNRIFSHSWLITGFVTGVT
jgi:hypothetical protein